MVMVALIYGQVIYHSMIPMQVALVVDITLHVWPGKDYQSVGGGGGR